MGRFTVHLRAVLAAGALSCSAIVSGCGIYIVEPALTMPSGISMKELELKFAGDNKAEFTSAGFNDTGYMLWFREAVNQPYRAVRFNGNTSRPTIPVTEIPPVTSIPGVSDDDGDPVVFYTVQIANMEHPDLYKSFLELKDEGGVFYFAVSAAGRDPQGVPTQSEMTEFGTWPP
jgi:hypothetical protein